MSQQNSSKFKKAFGHGGLTSRLILLFFILFVGACSGTPVAEDLNQNQANQIVALLSSQGISAYARKDAGGKSKYSVEINRSYYTQAKTLLVEKGLPNLDTPSFNELVEPRGILPNSRQIDLLRLDHAIAREIEEALSAHSAIVSVKALVRSNYVDDSGQRGASLVIQTRIGKLLEPEPVFAIVSKILPGIARENIIVSISEESQPAAVGKAKGLINIDGRVSQVPLVPFLFGWRVPESDYNMMVLVLIGCLLVLAALGGVIGYWAGYYQNSKQFMEGGLPDLSGRSLRIDRANRDLPEV